MTAVAHPAGNVAATKNPARAPIATSIIWTSLILGFVLRIARWIHFRSLWLDEIYLASSIVNRSMHDLLFKPLDNWQAAPSGFLFLTHLAMSLFGNGERSLRLVSLLFGLASLPLMLAVSRRLLTPRGVAVAMAAFSTLGPLIYYSNEVKPYSCDVAASLAIMLAALRWADDPTTRRTIIAAIVGAIAVFLSYPAIFVLAGAGVWMLWTNRDARRPLAIVGGTWLGFFVLDYFVFIRPYAVGDPHMHVVEYWLANDSFMPRSLIDAIHWLFSSLNAIARDPGAMWLDYPNAALIGLLIGFAIALRTRGKLLLLLAPYPFILIAAAARQYPFGDRLALFFVPQYLLLIALAAESLWTNFAAKAAAIVIVGLIVLPSTERSLYYLVSPHGREESLPVYRSIAAEYRPGDIIYLSHYAGPSFEYYASEAGFPPTAAAHVQVERMHPDEIIADVNSACGNHPRVWVILIHPELGGRDVQSLTLAAFNQIGHPVEQKQDFGVLGYLYDCATPR
jgi:uncharacterized membrane protein